MKKHLKHFLLLLSLVVIVSLMVGCQDKQSKEEAPDLKIETGVNNPDYKGIVNPQLDVEYKLTEEELKNGIKKLDMEGEEIDRAELLKEKEKAESGGEGGKRPNI